MTERSLFRTQIYQNGAFCIFLVKSEGTGKVREQSRSSARTLSCLPLYKPLRHQYQTP